MPLIPEHKLRKLTCELLSKAGAPENEARIVSDHLVDSNLAGHDSHGVVRIPGYVKFIQRGIATRSEYEVVKETPASAVINAKGGLGAVAALRAIEMAIDKAKTRTFGAVGVHNCGHTGRIGDYPPRAAKQELIGIALLNGGGRFTAPFGGTEGRLPPNPISVSVPRRDHEPILLDMTTSVVAGGKIDLKRICGEIIPEGWMVDREGKSVHKVEAGWIDQAAVLPLGGLQFGHKGYGLGFVIDCIAGGLSWAGCSSANPTRGGSGFLAMAINIADFIALDGFYNEVERLVSWVKECRLMPGTPEILLPGEFESRNRNNRMREGIPVDEAVWKQITQVAEELGVVG